MAGKTYRIGDTLATELPDPPEGKTFFITIYGNNPTSLLKRAEALEVALSGLKEYGDIAGYTIEEAF